MPRGRAVAFDPGSLYWDGLAQREMDYADIYAADGIRDGERLHWRMAARYEFKALATIPPGRVRTRCVIEESYLACLRRAQSLAGGGGM